MTQAIFRADPAKVRVSIRPWKGQWTVRIEDRSAPLTNWIQTTLVDVELALDVSLKNAAHIMKGIDIELQWTYEHPFGAAGAEARRHEFARFNGERS